VKVGQHLERLFLSVVLDQPSRRLRPEEHQHCDNHSWNQLEGKAQAPGSVAFDAQQAVLRPISHKDAKGDACVECSNDSAADLSWADLRSIARGRQLCSPALPTIS